MTRNPITDPQRGDKPTTSDGVRFEVLARYSQTVKVVKLLPDGSYDERAVIVILLKDWYGMFDKEPTDGKE